MSDELALSPLHRARDAAQACLGVDAVRTADVFEGAPDDPHVEVVVDGDHVPPAVARRLADRSLSINPDRTMTRGNPTTTVVVARQASE
jgi:hypothetical protein